LSFNGQSRGCRCQKFAIARKTVERNHGEEICHDPCHANFVAVAAGHQLPLMHCALTVPRYQILRLLNRLFLYSCSKPEHPSVGDHSCTTGNRSRNLCYNSWSLSHLTFLEEINEMNHAILREEEDAATEFPSILKLSIKKIKIAGNNPLTRQWWYDVMTSRPPPLPKNIEKCREEILDRVEEGWQEEDWTTTMPQMISELLQENFTFTRNLTSTRVSHAAEGVQWIHIEELGKALTNRCRAVRKLPNKKQKKLVGTRDRTTNSEQLGFECQLKTPTRGRIHELLNLGASSSQNLFQSLITNQDLLRLREDMWPSYKTLRKG